MLLGMAYVELRRLTAGAGLARDDRPGRRERSTGRSGLDVDVVEMSGPACKEQTEEYRRKVYAALVNDAVNSTTSRTWTRRSLATRGLTI
jgi:hypothetical protein